MFWRWLNPFDAWRELRQGGVSRHEMAVGAGRGRVYREHADVVFPHRLSLYVARRLHLNPLAVMSGSHVSAPPMGAFLVASAMWTGHVILHGSRPKWDNITLLHGKFMANAPSLLLDWTLGAVLIGTAPGIHRLHRGEFSIPIRREAQYRYRAAVHRRAGNPIPDGTMLEIVTS